MTRLAEVTHRLEISERAGCRSRISIRVIGLEIYAGIKLAPSQSPRRGVAMDNS